MNRFNAFGIAETERMAWAQLGKGKAHFSLEFYNNATVIMELD